MRYKILIFILIMFLYSCQDDGSLTGPKLNNYEIVNTWQSTESSITGAISLELSPFEEVAVCDYGNSKIEYFSSSGELIKTITNSEYV